MAITRFYTDAFEIWRGTPATDDRGATTMGTRAKVASGIGQINNNQVSEQSSSGQWINRDAYKLFTATTTDVRKNDNIKYDSDFYRVIGDPKNTITRGHHYRIKLEKLGKDNHG